MSQQQFLNVIDRDEAERRLHAAVRLEVLPAEVVPLGDALGRVLAEDVRAAVDVPGFDRSNYDGYAVRASDTDGADEQQPRVLALLDETAATGVVPRREVGPGQAMAIATGGMLPRGADAVAMVEHTELPVDDPAQLHVTRAVVPGHGVSFAGSDIASGETVLWRGQVLTSRETGTLAAIGRAEVPVHRRPKVAIISTGDELIPPEQPIRPPLVHDSNARILADAVRELGAEPVPLGLVPDDLEQLRLKLREALDRTDVVLLSGGTSKGEGDLSYRAVSELDEPGIVAHGVALKPGKPICLAGHRGKPVVILPGFPTSAVFTFHEFVAPLLLRLGGRAMRARHRLKARLSVKAASDPGRTEYLLVNLVPDPAQSSLAPGEDQGEGGTGGTPAAPRGAPPRGDGPEFAAFPMGKGSGSVTAFSRADGFITIARHEEFVPAGATVDVTLIGGAWRPADLTVIGSHCVGLDILLGRMQSAGFATKLLAVGSTAGLHAARAGRCDLAGVHLLDPATGRYNVHLVDDRVALLPGYTRVQGLMFRPDDERFVGNNAQEVITRVRDDPACRMIGRNAGSGTRALIDRLLDGRQPPGSAIQPSSHNAVAAAVAQRRADWGVAVEWVARQPLPGFPDGLAFLPLSEERYDWLIPRARLDRPAVAAFRAVLEREDVRQRLEEMGLHRSRGDA